MIVLSGAAIIDQNEKLLLLHHKKHHHFQFPGGKVEEGETPEEACIREAKEEIGCDVEIIRALPFSYFTSNGRKFRQHLFLAEIKKNQTPRVCEPETFDEIFRLRIGAFKNYPKLAPNVIKFCEQYMEGNLIF